MLLTVKNKSFPGPYAPEMTLYRGIYMTLNIVMVEPQIPQNTGNVARTCAATGARLHLVGPMGFTVDDAKLKRAGLDYWHLLDISYYTDIFEFYATNLVGTPSVDNENPYPLTAGQDLFYFSTKACRTYSDIEYADNSFLIFGSETKGLDERLLTKNIENCVRIPMINDARSLNLSNSVAVGVYEVLRQWNFPQLQNFGKLV